MKTAAAMANISHFAFSRNFKSAVGLNFSDYCNLLRIRFAEDELISTDLPISDIAAEIGTDTPSYFSRLFKNATGYPRRNSGTGTAPGDPGKHLMCKVN